MYVEHFNHSDSGGGASIAAYRLVSALNASALPVSSKLRVIQSSLNDVNILKPRNKSTLVLNKLARLFSSQLSRIDKHSHSNPYSLSLWPSSLPQILSQSDSDIVNLHWFQAESMSIEALPKITKPIVWTLHDTWGFCGATHYPDDLFDIRYQAGYKPRPSLCHPLQLDLNYLTWIRKVKAWKKPIHLVCPSQWMQRCANSSIIMRDWPTTVIPNPIPATFFQSRRKTISRHKYSLSPDCFVVSFSAHDLNDIRKGTHFLIELLTSIRSLHSNVAALVIGGPSIQLERALPVPSVFTGYLASEHDMAEALNCSDVHLVPSLIDNLPQTATEAQSCGVPTIAFNVGGLSDAIAHKVTGYLAEPYDVSEAVHFLSQLIRKVDTRLNMSRASRDRSIAIWSPDIIASKYFQLYAKILSR